MKIVVNGIEFEVDRAGKKDETLYCRKYDVFGDHKGHDWIQVNGNTVFVQILDVPYFGRLYLAVNEDIIYKPVTSYEVHF